MLTAHGDIDWTLVVLRRLDAPLLVPVVKEIFWRSFVVRWIQRPIILTVDPTTVALRAVLLSTFLFVLVHALWLAATLAALACRGSTDTPAGCGPVSSRMR